MVAGLLDLLADFQPLEKYMPSHPGSHIAKPTEDALEKIDCTSIQSSPSPGMAPKKQEARPLPAVLGMKDLTTFLVLIVVYIPLASSVQFGGPVAFLYWALGFLTFLIPTAFVTRWLARRFPGAGAQYLWAKRILGSNWSFFFAFCAWWPGVLIIVSTIQPSLVFIQFFLPTWFSTPIQQCALIVVLLLLVMAITCLPLHRLKHVLLVLAILYFGVFLLIGVAGSWWLWRGHAAARSLVIPGQWQPTGGNFAVYGIIILALLGIYAPMFAGNEIRGSESHIRHASNYVWWGSFIAFAAYLLGTFGTMVIVPPDQAGSFLAPVVALQIVFGPLIGSVAAIVAIGGIIATAIAYLLLFSRLLFVVAQDHRLPAPLTKVNRYGVPVLSIIMQTTIVAVMTMLMFFIIPGIFGSLVRPIDLAYETYNVLAAGFTAIWVFSTVQLFFLALWHLYRLKAMRAVSLRQHILLVTMCLLGLAASCVGIAATILTSWAPTLIPDGRWQALVSIVILVSLLIGWIASELPRVYALLGEQRRMNARETRLRQQLQEAYNEQEVLVLQQQELFLEVHRLYHEQAQAAVTDAITGLANHRAIMSKIEEELACCQQTQSSCAVLFVDLDYFKQINDTWGHRAGDVVLHEVGKRLRANLRTEDFVGRYGGEEFAIVLTASGLDAAIQAAERLRSAIATNVCFWEAEDTQQPIPIAVTASIGVAVYQLHGVTREALIEAADRGMYLAKHTGRNRVCLADNENDVSFPLEILAARNGQTIEAVGIQALTAAALAHDRGTGAHSERIARFAESTAHKLKLLDGEIHLIRLAALLHDIGKIGIPDAILHKPGQLTDEEWKIMRLHPAIGRQILGQIGGIFEYLASIVVAHHERWDGRGYPNSLAREAIPMSARILSVVDSYDAMTSRRSYREPLSAAEARAELQRCAGSQYDPKVVEAFLEVLDEQEHTEERRHKISMA